MESEIWKTYMAMGEDPIAKEREKFARERYIENLFRPFHDHDELSEIRWLVEGLLPMGYLALLAGNPKSGKTCFATALALAVAHGVPFAGRPTRQSSVLWIAAEESPTERYELVKGSPLYDTDAPFWTCYEKLNIDDDESLELLDEWLFKTNAKLLVVDPLMGAMGGRSLRDGYNARRTLQPLKDWCTRMVVLHHQKRDWYRMRPSVADSSQLAAVSSMSIVLSSFNAAASLPYIGEERSLCGGGTEGGGKATRKGTSNSPSSCSRRSRLNGRKGTGDGGQSKEKVRLEKPTSQRIVRLSCEGRGAWANRTQLFASSGPLDFIALDAEPSDSNPNAP